MNILAIETSCDDTCIAVLEAKDSKFKILSNIVSSQVKLHRKYGGVFPSLAKREHQRNLPIVLNKALRKAGFAISNFQFPIFKIDLIAVTAGPGLEPCLWTGINFAKELAKKLNLPVIPINHIEAHIFANFIKKLKAVFPAICLVVSGGHTQLILMRDFGEYRILGETRDDAAGECLDKAARILGLGYPGGPIISKLAKSPLKKRGISVNLPRPMIFQKNYDFSFSGLKTAVLYDFKNRPKKIRESPKESLRDPTGQEKNYRIAMAKEIQQAIIDVLITKTIKAAKEYKAKSVILGGGVASNDELRKQFKEKIKKEVPGCKFHIPEPQFCTDNATMIAITGYFHQMSKKTYEWKKIEADANLKIDESL